MIRESKRREKEALEALKMYKEPASVREVAEKMGISYGKAYELIKYAGGGREIFRPRGTRVRRQDDSE